MTDLAADDHLVVLAFLAARVGAPTRPQRCRGRSSDALVTWTLAGGEPPDTLRPADWDDWRACELTVQMAPPGLAARMRPVLERWREHVAGRCTERYAHVAAASAEMPPPQCEKRASHKDPHGPLRRYVS